MTRLPAFTLVVCACGQPSGGSQPAASKPVTITCNASGAGAGITVDAASKLGPLRSLQGFLHGIDARATFDQPLIAALKPAFWRFGTGSDTLFPKISGFGAKLTYVVSDGYADSRGGYSKARPWEDWAGTESFITSAAQANLQAGRPITFFDAWGEPQGGTPWLGTYDQLLEYYARTIRTLRAADPTAKVIGPTYDDFEGTIEGHGLFDVIVDLDARYQLRFDAIAWHELGAQPAEQLPAHTASLRQRLAARFPGYQPELHVNEYANTAQHLVPGWSVGWLFYLTEANVDAANRACWNVPGEGWSDCWAGLNGLLRPDNRTPQHTYWVHRSYADLVDGQRLRTTSTDPHAVALAVQQSQHLLLLTGRFASSPAAPLTLTLQGLPPNTTSVDVTASVIPATGVPGALPAPQTPAPCHATVGDGGLTVLVNDYPDGAAVSFDVTLTP